MVLRDQSFVDRVARAEKDLLDFKNAQIFGKDVTQPKVIQRYNSDGTPTEWDVQGVFQDLGGGFTRYTLGGRITYKARNQTTPWATVYVKLKINPSGEFVTGGAGIYYSFNAYPHIGDKWSQGDIFAQTDGSLFGNDGTIIFDVDGGASSSYGPPTDASIDRYWAKIYILATDFGDMKLEFPYGSYGAGTVVPTT